LFPHGVLFRDAEREIRKKMIENDYVDAVIGLGKNLFYNSSMESCLLVCRMRKPEQRRGKIIFIDARDELRIERTNAWLESKNIKKISEAYWDFISVPRFASVISYQKVLDNAGNLSVPLYVKKSDEFETDSLIELVTDAKERNEMIRSSFYTLIEQLEKIGIKL
jgi:type I restriction enzyme M protein